MAYIEVEVDIDVSEHLHEVNKEDLINELEGRGIKVDSQPISLIQEMILTEFNKVFRDIPQEEFDNFIKKYK